MMDLFKVLYILLAHWIADFVLQSDEDAKNKSKNWANLLNHTSIYSLFMTGAIMFLYPISVKSLLLFYLIMLVSHTLIDAVTSRINSKLWAKGKVHNFFVSIGFDQWIHYAVLFTTIKYLFE
jgi:membrane-bound metal-dependent hydrolase YbcI (DUF457 family)